MREPDDEALQKIASALGVTPALLRRASKVRGAVAVDAHMRRKKTAKPGDWRRLEARLNVHRMHARQVFDEIAVRSEHRIPSFDPFDTDAATAARFLRMQWRMPTGPVRGLVRWVESAGCVVLQEDFGTTGVDGLSQWIDEIPIMLVNLTAPTDRKRLTIAHELGHLCLHTQDVFEDMEKQATDFAAEFLMPAEVIRPQLRNLTLGRLLDLKREWHVSVAALVERAWELKLITPSKRQSLYKGLSAKGWRQREPISDELPPEDAELPEQIGSAIAARGLDIEEVAHVIGLADASQPHPFLPRQRLRAV